jgi:HK97 family phage major capsid protein
MYSESQVQELIDKMGSAFLDNKAQMESRIDAIEKHAAIAQFPGGYSTSNGNTKAAKEHAAAFQGWARKGVDPENLKRLEVQASLSTLSDPDGGFLVPVELEKNIERLSLASVAMRRLARIVTARGEYVKPLSVGGATGGWVVEKGTRAETSTPELTLFQPPMCEIYAMPSATQKLLDMAEFDVANWLLEEINDVFVATEGAGFITGNGVGQVKGILDSSLMVANASWSYRKTGFITSGAASTLSNIDKLFDLQHALKPVYRQGATWLMNDSTWALIRKFKDGNGDYLWRAGLLEGSPSTLLGNPVAIDSFMPDIGAGAYPIAFGDFKRAYTIVDHSVGTRLLRDPYSVKGSVLFYVSKRLAAGVSNYEALKFLKIAA